MVVGWYAWLLSKPQLNHKNLSIYKVHGTQNDRLELTVSTQKIGFEKYAAGLEILSKMCQNLGCQTKPAYSLFSGLVGFGAYWLKPNRPRLGSIVMGLLPKPPNLT